jgi:hypothetical protein
MVKALPQSGCQRRITGRSIGVSKRHSHIA